ncbi:MAG: Ig-like domain repeat protein [Terracidiphilus sp.]
MTPSTSAQTIAYVQGNFATPQTAQTTVKVKFSAAQVAGDLNVVVVGWNDSTATVSAVTDSSGNTYALAVGPTIQTGYSSQSIYFAKNVVSAAAGSNTVTVTFKSAAQYPDIRVLEYSGADPNNPVDVIAANTGNNATSQSASATTTTATDLIFGANLVQTMTNGSGSGFTKRLLTTPDSDLAEDKMVTAAGSYSTTAPLSSSGPWIMQLVAFRTPSGGTPPPITATGLSCSSASMTGPGTDSCTVSLSAAAPSGGLSVSLSSSNTMVAVPATVTVPASATSATFMATVQSVATAQAVTLTAGAGGVSKTFTLQLSANQPTLTLASSGSPSAYGGAVTFTATISSGPTGTVTFYDGGTVIGTGTLNGTAATLTTSSLTAGSQTITASWPGNSNYCAATSSAITQAVNKATPTITWATPAAIVYGTALSGTQLNASSTVAGTFNYSPAAGTVLTAGSHTITATFTPTNSTDYATVTSSISITVSAATPPITWATPAAIVYGTALSGTQLDASSTVAGTFSYSPAAGTVLATGSHAITATFTPTDTTDYTIATATVTLTVNANATTPTIAWAAPAAITYGTALSSTQLNASSTVAGSFTYSPIAGTMLKAGAQTLSVTFTPTDTTDYTTATATVTLTVNRATPVINWATPGTILSGTALSSTQLDASSAIPGVFVYSPAAGAVLAVGSQTLSVAFTPTDTTDYTTATKTVTLTVNQAISTLSINATSIAFGNVVINTPTTQSVTLTSTGTAAVTVNSAVVTGTGFTVSGATLPATLTPGQAVTLGVEFDPTTAGAATGQLTITSTSSTNGTAVIALTGTGTAAAYTVDLSWDAPGSSQDPVAGYDIYRAPSGGTIYQQVNSSVVTTTAFVDSTVQGGATYDYYVESVDASGVESVPSSTFAVTIP